MTDQQPEEKKITPEQIAALARAESLEEEAAKLRLENKLDAIFIFPPVVDYGGHELDPKTNTLWIALKIDTMDYVGALAFLHTMEHVVWQFYKEMARQMKIRQQLAAAAPKMPEPKPTKKGLRALLSGN